VPRFIVASLVAFWLGEFTNSYTLAKMKLWTDGKWLWTRTVGSTVTGQFVDTTVLILIAFGGYTPWATMLNLILSGYFAKVLYEVLATPITYLIVNRLKRAEGVDVYDRDTNFNPFARNREAAAQL
jgi:queuosine precursor transporter